MQKTGKLTYFQLEKLGILDIEGMCERLGISRKTLYRGINTGDIPKPKKIGNQSIWLISELGGKNAA